ncbi:MAG: type II toxin-antitoxin system prevent-host-death family antitoxin [Thermomicrobiales bacterium]
MRQYEPITQNMDIAEIESSLANVVSRVTGNDARVVVEKHGQPVAAIISIEDLRRYAQLEAARKNDFAVFDHIEAAFSDVPASEVEEAVDRALANVRASTRGGSSHE